MDGVTYDDVQLQAAYWAQLEVTLTPKIELDRLPHSLPKTIRLSGRPFDSGLDAIAIKLDSEVLTFVSRENPFPIHFSNEILKVTAVVICGPEFHFHKNEFLFADETFELKYIEFSEARSMRKAKSDLDESFVATGIIELRRKNGCSFSPSNIWKFLNCWTRFLNFVRGGRVGIGNLVATGRDGSVAYASLGFTKSDKFKTADGWCRIGQINSLPEIFSNFRSADEKSATGDALRNAITFYGAANVIDATAREIAFVTACTNVEALSSFILSTKAGWTDRLMQKSHLSEKIRAATKFIGLTSEPLEHLDELKKWSKEQNCADGFETVTRIRNRIVHQGKPIQYSGKTLLEAHFLSMWLSEIFIFFLIGYRGEMSDRRMSGHWFGQETCKVPLPLCSN
jgi:hypothetical protein